MLQMILWGLTRNGEKKECSNDQEDHQKWDLGRWLDECLALDTGPRVVV